MWKNAAGPEKLEQCSAIIQNTRLAQIDLPY